MPVIPSSHFPVQPSGSSASSLIRVLYREIRRGLAYGCIAYLITALYVFSFPETAFSLFQKIDQALLGTAYPVQTVADDSYAHVCPIETVLRVEQIPQWGQFYYCERTTPDGALTKHGPWAYWGKFGVKLRQGQFENGKKVGLWYSWKGVEREKYRVDEYVDDELLFVRHYDAGKRVRVFSFSNGKLLELEQT